VTVPGSGRTSGFRDGCKRMAGPILVLGATGRLGERVTRRLVEAGLAVRVLVRDPARLRVPGVEVMRGDLADPESMKAAVHGVSQVFSTAYGFRPDAPSGSAERDEAGYASLLWVARETGVERIVLTSIHGASRRSPDALLRARGRIEARVRGWGIPSVILRPAAFIETWYEALASEIEAGGKARVFGSGTSEANLIAMDDVADAVGRVVERRELVDRSIDLGGPSTLSQLGFVEAVARWYGVDPRIGRGGAGWRRIPRELLRLVRPAEARRRAQGEWIAAFDQRMDDWREGAALLGLRPMDLADWLARVGGNPGPGRRPSSAAGSGAAGSGAGRA